ncbi:DUF4070 domain-containing protein [Siculibacillus lacustris]|uniref:DUF4070 domain-containing protein n=2 Tax=Siculibacillus lacustris TaxID=1549641 RepID=A0A4Q9VKP8_9HYPH|nr:DUF4070 domain-containing protein [Siculibacillus lacustris]
MVFPRFLENSFWSMRATVDLWGAAGTAPPLGLLTVAALLPPHWAVRLVDRNAAEVTEADLAWADMVMTGGMLPQRTDTLAVIDLARRHVIPVVVGGPDPMSCPEAYGRADFRVLGEAEGLIERFIDAWERGERAGTFDTAKFSADVTTSPVPRFDLVDFRNYLYVGVQFSRGCPFSCEFCDIIELYGRNPRSKTNDQMLAELQRLYDLGHRGHVDFVDDNLIGNKKALRRFLPVLEAWQRERGYPFLFSTEASINLADDLPLLALMKACNFFVVFVGIESPDSDTLIATSKKQNTRRDLADGVHTIYRAGIFVVAGFIVGFDTEKPGTAEAMIDCIRTTSIPVAMVGLLTALPNTRLRRRLEAEGRLLPDPDEVPADQCTGGLNFRPLRPRADVLADYRSILSTVYAPEAFFERLRDVGRRLDRPTFPVRLYPRLVLRDLRLFARLIWRFTVTLPHLRRPFWRTLLDVARHNPRAVEPVVMMMAMYLHLGPFAATVGQRLGEMIADCAIRPEPEPIAAPKRPPAAVAEVRPNDGKSPRVGSERSPDTAA